VNYLDPGPHPICPGCGEVRLAPPLQLCSICLVGRDRPALRWLGRGLRFTARFVAIPIGLLGLAFLVPAHFLLWVLDALVAFSQRDGAR